MTRVDKRIFEEIKDYIREKREWLDNLGDATVPQPVQASFIPGGLAVSPVNRNEFYVTDNSAGRLLAIVSNEFGSYRQIELLNGLDHPGDVDIADGGRSLVFTEQSKVRKVFFGLTGVITDGTGQPLTGASVVFRGRFPCDNHQNRCDGNRLYHGSGEARHERLSGTDDRDLYG